MLTRDNAKRLELIEHEVEKRWQRLKIKSQHPEL
jgi:hypothetical protein